MAVMVWCQSCKTVVWAYDHQPKVDLRGICNMLKLPCPKCGDVCNFDGWASDNPIEQVNQAFKGHNKAYDAWSVMRIIATLSELEWEISPDCSWFKRPGHTQEDYNNLMREIVAQIRFKATPAPEI